jgi:hypothetical protein
MLQRTIFPAVYMDPRQQLIDDLATLCGPSVAVLNLDEVQASAPMDPPRILATQLTAPSVPGRRRCWPWQVVGRLRTGGLFNVAGRPVRMLVTGSAPCTLIP